MPARDDSASENLAQSFGKLSTTASKLNKATKQLSATIVALDEVLKRLNLGVSSWVQFGGGESEDGGSETSYELGYAKIKGKWGLAIRHSSWSTMDPDRGSCHEWLFGDASRELRLSAIDYVPELVEKLNQDASETTAKLDRKIKEAELLTKILNNIDAAEYNSNSGVAR